MPGSSNRRRKRADDERPVLHLVTLGRHAQTELEAARLLLLRLERSEASPTDADVVGRALAYFRGHLEERAAELHL
jgi:hypothetical protein